MIESTQVPARERIDKEEIPTLEKSGVLVVNNNRRRPLYFDGRFLAARDLTREQTYFLSRQAELGRAGGSGVVDGLLVTQGSAASTIVISPGHGVTPQGEIVVLPKSLTVDIADIPTLQRLDVAFRLSRIPREPTRNLSGLFVVALRPVEYSANPIAAYPTTLDGVRTATDGDIIEAVIVTLIPYADRAADTTLDMRRAHAAYDIFIQGKTPGAVTGALPLAMIALDRGVVQWVDPYLVRREVGAEHKDILDLGFAPRAVREAFLLQYDNHLQYILKGRDTGQGPQFVASKYFLALPAAGRMPTNVINTGDFTQVFFPPEMDVDLSIIPDDELPALLEESMLLPPFDLTLTGDDQESSSVLVLIPIPRQRLPRLQKLLESLTRPLKPAIPGLLGRRKPAEVLSELRLGRLPLPVQPQQPLIDAGWAKVLAEVDTLWYVRRRNLQYKTEVVGVHVRTTGDELSKERTMMDLMRQERLMTRFTNLKRRASADGDAEMVSLFTSPKMKTSRTLLQGGMYELEIQKRLDHASTMVVSERYADPQMGEGLMRLENADPSLTSNAVRSVLVQSISVPEIDRLGRLLPEAEVAPVTQKIVELARAGNPKGLAKYVSQKLKEVV